MKNVTYIAALRKLHLINYLNLYPIISIGNKKVTIPILKGIGQQNLLMSEPWMLDLFNSYKDRLSAGAFLDVGFNVGQTLIKYRTIFKDTAYIGFDPNPICAFYVTELIKSNKWLNSEIIPIGISNETGVKELFLYEEAIVDSSASIVKEFRNNIPVKSTLRIPVYSFEYIAGFKEITGSLACIKIDVEGGELEVIKSFVDLIRQKRPLILIEILPAYSDSNTVRIARQHEVENIFRELNYKCQVIVKDGSGRLESLRSIHSIGIHGDINRSDYIYSPAEIS